jgi:hypothetical protein
MGGLKKAFTAIYTGTCSLYLYIFVGLMMNQDESIFVAIFSNNVVFKTNIFQLNVLSSYY